MYISIVAWSFSAIITWQGFNRNKVIKYTNIFFAILLAIWGIVVYPKNIPYKINSNIAGVLFSPIALIIIHMLLSKAYYYLYGFSPEPNLYMTNKGKHSNRELNILDHLVILIPTIISFYIGLTLSR